MPRRTTTTGTTSTAEVLNTDLEPTPFDNFTMPSHEAKLNDLDSRGDALNGHGVRPSEMCGVVAGSGPYPGRRCTFRQHENDAPHSWEASSCSS